MRTRRIKNGRCRWAINVKCFGKAMSEFKYACPVCGQHIKCDSSQAGSQMECPTCFQKITVPQAPTTDDQKFIITGTMKSERPIPTIPEAPSSFVPAAKGFPGVLVVVVIFIFIGAAVAFVYHGTIFKSRNAPTAEQTNQITAKTQKPSKPELVVPPANDTNWTLNLDAVATPDSTAAGRIHGQDFIVERALFQNGALELRGPANLEAAINFGGVQAEALAGQSINVATDAETAAHLTLRWKEDRSSLREDFTKGYALRLEFGAQVKNHLPGKIYLCTPDDQKSYIAGDFNAEIRKPKPKKQ